LDPLLTRVHAPGRSRPDIAVQRPPVDLWLRSYEGAGALSGVYEALDSQKGECPCRRGTGHAPLLSDLALRGNLIPRLKLAPRDLVTDVGSDLHVLGQRLLELWRHVLRSLLASG